MGDEPIKRMNGQYIYPGTRVYALWSRRIKRAQRRFYTVVGVMVVLACVAVLVVVVVSLAEAYS